MSMTAYLCMAAISSYDMFAAPVPVVVESLIPDRLLQLHQQMFYATTSAMIPFAFPIRLAFRIFMSILVPVLSRLFYPLKASVIALILRKRYFQDRVAHRIRQHARQVLILGAGYDALGTLFSEMYPNVLFVEVDQPTMSHFKKSIVQQLGKHRGNMVFLAVDLAAENFEEKLLRDVPGWDVNAKTVVIAEGLFMYLTSESVRRCMHSLRTVTPSDTLVAFSYLQKPKHDQVWGPFPNWLLHMPKLLGKPLKWIPNNEEEVANVIEGDEFYAELAPHESNLFRKYLRDNQFELDDHPMFRNCTGTAMSK